jgi:uncharacterized protein (TIGR03083 family)
VSELTDALRTSVDRLRELVEGMDDAQLGAPAYPSQWTEADVLSHIGSGAVIMRRRLDDSLAGEDTPDEFAPGVWDEWNAKSSKAKAQDALAADSRLMERIESTSAEERAQLQLPMGPMNFDFDMFVGMRLNEHALHTWDIEVVGDPSATVPEQAADLIIDRLELIARYTAKPAGAELDVLVRTTAPERLFRILAADDGLTFVPETAAGAGQPTLQLPAEAFIRLVYGRLDPPHTPPIDDAAELLGRLRTIFPGP